MIAPMLRHGRYEARLLATDMPLTTAGLIIIGNYAALDFYATSATGEIDSVIVHRNAPAIQMLRDYAERLSEVQIPLYSRYERVRSEQKPVMADGERQFRQELLEVSKIGDRVDFMLLRVPNPLLPVDVYERALTARASVANAVSPDDGVGQLRPPFDTRHPARAHSKRADTLVEQLERWERQLTNEAGIASRQRRKSAGTINPGCRVVLGRSTMIELAGDGAVAGSAAWRRLTGPEIVSIIDNLVTLVRRFPHALQFAIVDESELPPIASDDRARWEIRSFLTGGGKVMFQMDTGEGTDELERRIHLGFEDDDVVRAFREFTDKICDEKSPHVLLGEEAVRFLDVDLRSLAVARSPVVTNAV